MVIKKFAGIFLIAFSLFSCNFGKGKISVEIIYPEKTLVNPSLSVTAQPAGGNAEEYTNKDGKELIISPVEAGNYTLIIRLKDGETIVWEKQISCVVDGAITTRIRYTVTEADFTDFALYKPEIIVTELGENRYKIEIISSNYKGDIYYTMTQPAEDPTVSSSKYITAFEIDYTADQGKVLTARVFYKDFDPSEPAVLYLTKVETPVIQDTTPHRLNDKLTFSVTSSDKEAKYYYTLDGTVPNAVSSQTNGVIELTKPGTITVKGFKESYLMSDSAVLPVERLPKPVFGSVTENPDGLTYQVTISYGSGATAMFLTKDRTSVTSENCPTGTEIALTGDPAEYSVSDLTPEQTLKTRSIAVNFFASEEAVLESQAAEKPVITDARAKTKSWADPLAVVFTSPEPGAVLRYTFDGSIPTQDSPSAVSGEAVLVTVPAGDETDVTVRSYVDGKYPSSSVSVKAIKAAAPQAVALGYWNRVEITENTVIDAAEKATRRLFYRVKDSEAWLPFEGEVYLDETAETTVEAVGGSEFYFPSEPVTEGTFTVLAKPTVSDTRSAGAGCLDSLRIALSSDGDAADAVKYYYTANGADPTRTSSTEAADSGAVSVGKTETLKAVATGLNRITSEVSDPVDGTPLNPPKLSVDDTGIVTITAADTDAGVAGIVFFYKIDSDEAFSSVASGTQYDGNSPPQLTANQVLYAVAAAPMRNPSDKVMLTLKRSDPPTISDSREKSGQYYLDLSLLIEGKEGDSLFYALGADEPAVDTPTLPYNAAVSPSKDNNENWIGAAAKADSELKSETVKQQLFTFADAPQIGTMTHDVASNRFNLVTITVPAAPAGSGLSVIPVFYTRGADFTVEENVSLYTGEFEAVSPADADGVVTVSAIAGGKFCYPTTEVSATYDQTVEPDITDARTEFYKTLKVTAAAVAPDDTAIVYSSADGTTWNAVAGEVTVPAGETGRFMAAVDGKLTSKIKEIDGTPLNPPRLDFADDGSVTVTAADENGGSIFYYIVGDTADFEAGTATELTGTTIPANEVTAGQTVFVVAAEEMKNPSSVVSIRGEQTDPPVFTDTRANLFYKPLSVAISGKNVLYAEGATEDEVKTPNLSYTDPVNPADTSLWLGATAKEAEKLRSDLATRRLYQFADTPTVTVTHSEAELNLVTITGPAAPVGFTGAVAVYYILDGTEFADSTTVQSYTGSFTVPKVLVEAAWTNGSLPVKIRAGGEFCHPSSDQSEDIPLTASPEVTDARNTEIYKTLKVTAAANASDSTATVYSSVDGTTWSAVAGEVTVPAGETGRFMAAVDGKLTSQITEVDGTPLNPPTLKYENDGSVTVTAAAANGGTAFYYIATAGDTADFETGTVSEVNSQTIPADEIAGRTVFVVAAEEMKNPSSPAKLTSKVSQNPVITDNRGGDFSKPLEMAVTAGPGAEIYVTEGTPAADPNGSETPYSGPITPDSTSTSVKAAAREPESMMSDVVEQTLYALQGEPGITVEHKDGQWNLLTISYSDSGYTFGKEIKIYYSTDGSDPTTLYSAPVALPADTVGPVTVKAVAGAEFCHSTGVAEKTFTRSTQPSFTDARGVNLFEVLSMTSSDTNVYYAVTDSDSQPAAADFQTYTQNDPVEIQPGKHLHAVCAETDFLVSAPHHTDGTPLPTPTPKIDGTNFSYAEYISANSGVKVYYAFDGAEPDSSSDSVADGTPIPLDAHTSIKSIAVRESRNKSSVDEYSQSKSTSPVIEDARAGSWNLPLSVAFKSTQTAENFYYELGSPAAVPTESSATNDGTPVTVADGNTSVQVAAKEAGKTLSDPVSQEFFTISKAPEITISHSPLPNTITLTVPADAVSAGYTGTPVIWYTTDGSEPTAGTAVKYTVPFTLPADGSAVTVRAVIGGEFCHQSAQELNTTIDAAAESGIEDARGGNYFDPLSVKKKDTETRTVYSSADGGTSWQEMTAPVSVGTSETRLFIAVEEGKAASAPAEITGAPLSEPQARFVKTAAGQPGFTYTYDFSVDGVKIYYDNTTPTMASAGIDAVPADAIALNDWTTVFSAAAAPLRNSSSIHQLTVNKAEITVQDARGGNYYQPLSVTFNGVNAGESVNVTDGVSTLTWSAGDAALDISSLNAEVTYVLVSDSRYSDEKSFDPTGLTAPVIELDGGQIRMSHSNSAGDIWYAVGESTATAADVKPYTVPFTPTGADQIFGAVGAELKHPAETEFTPTLPKAETPIVTDSRTATGPSDYLTPAFTESPKSFNLIIQSPTDGSTVYVTDPSGAETPVAGNSVTVDIEGTYTFVAKGTGLSDSDSITIEVKQLNSPTMDFKNGKVTLISDGDTILYNYGSDPVADVADGATVYGGSFDAVGGEIVKAVAVKEFCFASEQMTETIPNNEPLSLWFERDGKTINSQYLSEAIDVTVCVPAEYQTRTIRYALKTKNEPAPVESEYVLYTVGTPISIDVSSDLYAQVLNTDGTAVEQSATLKIRLQCPHPNPILEVSEDKTEYHLSFTSLNDSLFEIKVTVNNGSEISYIEGQDPISINPGDTYSAKTSRVGWEDSGTVGGTVPEILKKKGLNN